MRNMAIFVLGSIMAGFTASTGAAFINGYSPCEIYGFCESHVLAENHRLLNEASELKDEINQINRDNRQRVADISAKLKEQKALNTTLTDGITKIVSISDEGVSNEEKLREIAGALGVIGENLRMGAAD